MAWNLEIVYSGLCMFYLPDPYDMRDPLKQPQVLLVDACGHHAHEPLLCFNPEDLDDLSVNLDTLAPEHRFVVNERSNHLAEILLERREIILELPDDQSSLRYENRTGAAGDRPRWPNTVKKERDLRWIAPICDLHSSAAGIRIGCLRPLEEALHYGVISKMKLKYGTLAAHRLGKNFGDYAVWTFYPDKSGSRRPPVQVLADQVVLELKGLEDFATVKILDEGENEVCYLKFPSDPDAELVRLSVSNLPPAPEPFADEIIAHFRAAYELLCWDTFPKPEGKDLPAPRPLTGRNFLGGSGGGQQQFCPCATCK